MNKFLKQAFTLIELLVVIAIIGILSGLIVVSMGGMTQKATIAKAQVFSNSLRNSLMMSLVSIWNFEGITAVDSLVTSSDLKDSWGSNNGSIAISGAIVKGGSDCISGKCVKLDGADDFNVPDSDSLDVTSGLTIEGWVKVTAFANNTYEYILRKYNIADSSFNSAYGLGFQRDDSRVLFQSYTTTGSKTLNSLTYLDIDTWYHIVATYDSSFPKVAIYINGKLDNSSTTAFTGTILTSTGGILIGWGNPTPFLNGTIDEVRIYNASIPTSQIQEQYYSGLNKMLASGQVSIEEYQDNILRLSQYSANK